MILAKTTSGFEIELDENVIDYILMEDLALMQKDGSKLFAVVDRFLGEENKKRLLAHLADSNGRVPAETVVAAVGELLNSFAAGKNSSSSPT